MNRAELRGVVEARSHGRCEWPEHSGHTGDELAHFHSVGMGGNPDLTRDAETNVGWFCHDAARVSDGEYGSGGAEQYREFHLQLFGQTLFDEALASSRAWARADLLTRYIKALYG